MKFLNAAFATDGYKTGHIWMYPKGTSTVVSNFTPRSNKYGIKGCDYVISFGQTMVMRQIHDLFQDNFFKTKEREELALKLSGYSLNKKLEELKRPIIDQIKKEFSLYLNEDYDPTHFEELWDLGYIPIRVKAIPEGTKVKIGIPVLTIRNTIRKFFWITNFLETIISNLLWKPLTNATYAYEFKNVLLKWAKKTDKENIAAVDYQGHDFSMRSLSGLDTVALSGLAHAINFKGSDSLPVILSAREYYNAQHTVIQSVNATEHSVMCAGEKGEELETFRYLMKQFPKGILSIVSDTWDLWKVILVYLPLLKDEIMKREGKIVIRPDSGDPADIICGTDSNYIEIFRQFVGEETLKDEFRTHLLNKAFNENIHGRKGENEVAGKYKIEGKYYEAKINNLRWENYDEKFFYIDVNYEYDISFVEIEKTPQMKGVVELLYELFGGKINNQGYKTLDEHIGTIYGDSINLERAEEICRRLEEKGFSSTNVVLGIGGFTYQYNTRDTFGFAMKATYVEVNEIGKPIFKDPITDDGTKKSAKGLLKVNEDMTLSDQVTWEQEDEGLLREIYMNGEMTKVSFEEIRERLEKTR